MCSAGCTDVCPASELFANINHIRTDNRGPWLEWTSIVEYQLNLCLVDTRGASFLALGQVIVEQASSSAENDLVKYICISYAPGIVPYNYVYETVAVSRHMPALTSQTRTGHARLASPGIDNIADVHLR